MGQVQTNILGTGADVPEKVLSNRDLERFVETSDAWIVERTGIRERRVAAPEDASSDLAVRASRRALDMAGTRPEELDLIVVGTITPDLPMPSCAALLQAKLGATRAFAFDVSAACAGSLYALSVADQYIRSGSVRRALVVGVELLTRIVNWEDRNTCVLFGDAAGAMVLGPGPGGHEVLSVRLRTDGRAASSLLIPGGGSKTPMTEEGVRKKLNTVVMNGREVFRFAVRALEEVVRETLEEGGLTSADVAHFIPHQANIRIIEAVAQRLGIPMEKCWSNIDRYGNTSSASMPLSLDEANRQGRLQPGELVALAAIGGGMAWGGALVRW